MRNLEEVDNWKYEFGVIKNGIFGDIRFCNLFILWVSYLTEAWRVMSKNAQIMQTIVSRVHAREL